MTGERDFAAIIHLAYNKFATCILSTTDLGFRRYLIDQLSLVSALFSLHKNCVMCSDSRVFYLPELDILVDELLLIQPYSKILYSTVLLCQRVART